jgi:hypothetical protein
MGESMKLLTVFFVVCFVSFKGHCDELTPAKSNDIRLLMQETGSANLGAQMINGMVPLLTQSLFTSHPEIPKKRLKKLAADLD